MEPKPPQQPGNPIPKPPRAIPVTIRVKRNDRNEPVEIIVEPATVTINQNEQVAWSSPDGRLEIRFGRSITPFSGDSFEVARGGTSFSGSPVARRAMLSSHKYTVLVTTPDGFFLTKAAEVKIAVGDKNPY